VRLKKKGEFILPLRVVPYEQAVVRWRE
jgi:hypothetical protein